MVRVELQWCPAHKEMQENEKAAGWAKLAAGGPEARGVESLGFGNRCGRRRLPPNLLAHLKGSITETNRGLNSPAGPRAARVLLGRSSPG